MNLFDHLKTVHQQNRTSFLQLQARLSCVLQAIEAYNVQYPSAVAFHIEEARKALENNKFVDADMPNS